MKKTKKYASKTNLNYRNLQKIELSTPEPKNLPNSKIPIIAITGNAKNYTIEDFQEIGINNYLPKPLNYDHMVEMISKYVS